MNILVFNCGSSSLKYRLLEMPSERELAGGEAQRVGPPTAEPARIIHRVRGAEETHQAAMPNQAAALEQVMRLLASDESLMPEVVAHRMVHGADRFDRHALLDERALADLEAIQGMAPLHNPPALAVVKACRNRYPNLPQVIVFDTAFHATIPKVAHTYALPVRLRSELGIRKYGFHGISHQYVTGEAAGILGIPRDEFNGVSCHLGSGGASLCAVKGGQSVDNTMGYSPLQGLLMSTRCGDLDPAVAMRLLALTGGDHNAVEKLLNKRSGVLGLSGLSSDIRDVLDARQKGNGGSDKLDLAIKVYLWRVRKYLGAYLTVLGSAHAVVFTDTIGETVPEVRSMVCADMQAFGLEVDSERNLNAHSLPADVGSEGSAVRVLVIRTNEELAIARYANEILARQTRKAGGETE